MVSFSNQQASLTVYNSQAKHDIYLISLYLTPPIRSYQQGNTNTIVFYSCTRKYELHASFSRQFSQCIYASQVKKFLRDLLVCRHILLSGPISPLLTIYF